MDEPKIKATIASLVAKIEAMSTELSTLRVENAALREANAYRKRPTVMRGRTVETNVGCGPLYVTVNDDDRGRPFEVFFKLGKSGSCQQSYLEALGVVMSVGLRCGADPNKFIEKLAGMRCPNPRTRMDGKGPSTLSCADGVSQGLARALALTVLKPPSEDDIDTVLPPAATPPYLVKSESIDLIASLPDSLSSNGYASNGHANGSTAVLEKKMDFRSGVGMCPLCGDVVIYQSGCESCRSQCGFVGKCS